MQAVGTVLFFFNNLLSLLLTYVLGMSLKQMFGQLELSLTYFFVDFHHSEGSFFLT